MPFYENCGTFFASSKYFKCKRWNDSVKSGFEKKNDDVVEVSAEAFREIQ